jgi:tryptophanyl-tRNA synthetase
VNVGLFDYPVLMAGDVLLYDAAVVPVGDDQLQHLELTRTLARKFNARFGKIFIEPKGLLTKTPRVMSLKDPAKKMSKSQPEGCLFLDDSPEDIRAKIARAVTDSDTKIEYDPERKPGLSNLLEIYAALDEHGTSEVGQATGKSCEPKEIAREFAGKSYSEFKKSLAELVADYFANFRAQKQKLLTKPATLVKILNDGSARAAKVADAKMDEVKKRVGLAIE